MARQNWLDAAKGFGAALVALGHIAAYFVDASWFPGQSQALLALRGAIYSFHMPLYFILSGLVFALAYLDGGGKVRRGKVGSQLWDLLWNYILWSVLYVVTEHLFAAQLATVTPFSALLTLPLYAIEIYWYLYVLFFCYALTLLLVRRCSPALWVLVGVGLCLLWYLAPLPELTASKLCLYYLFFALGAWLGRRREALAQLGRPGPILALAAVGLGLLAFRLPRGGTARFGEWALWPLGGVGMALCLALAALGLFQALGRRYSFPLLSTLGRCSLEIYLTHIFTFTLARLLLPRLGVTGFGPVMVLSLGLTVGLPVAASWLLERLGLRRLLFRPAAWLRGRKKQTAQ